MATSGRAEWRISAEKVETSATYEPATGALAGVFVCAHGAGGNKDDRGLVSAARAMREAGLGVVRYNFPYRERKSGRPDPMPRLIDCVRAVAEHTARELGPVPLFVGGRSMGGRAASMLAAKGFHAQGLILLAYPLHPAGQPQQLRDAHLGDIAMPVLCFNGTRDALCRRDLMNVVVSRLGPNWAMHWLEGADHSFHVLRSSGRGDEDVLTEVTAATRAWLVRVVRPSHETTIS